MQNLKSQKPENEMQWPRESKKENAVASLIHLWENAVHGATA